MNGFDNAASSVHDSLAFFRSYESSSSASPTSSSSPLEQVTTSQSPTSALKPRQTPATRVMGILNVTPDSFSDGNRWLETGRAVEHGLRMAEEGSLIVDVGGESTRPGAAKVTADEEWGRISAVVEGLADAGVAVSVDTLHASTARKAVDAGAALINDVSGGSFDPQMAATVARLGVPFVIQHWRGFPSDPALNTEYEDVVADVVLELQTQVDRALAAGLQEWQVIVDPGLGFAKGADDSWKLVQNLDALVAMGYPVLVGGSRKRFVADRFGEALERGTLNVTEIAACSGVWAVRVHEVKGNAELIKSLDCGQ